MLTTISGIQTKMVYGYKLKPCRHYISKKESIVSYIQWNIQFLTPDQWCSSNSGTKFYKREYFSKKFRKRGIFNRFLKHERVPFNSFRKTGGRDKRSLCPLVFVRFGLETVYNYFMSLMYQFPSHTLKNYLFINNYQLLILFLKKKFLMTINV